MAVNLALVYVYLYRTFEYGEGKEIGRFMF